MSERFRMNRMGFVNFWLYDEEVFSFADGKMLLRGQNGSGKSITTQSFIPFILDGDKTPSRLDPFGSNDRRMEFYLLGEGEKEDVTGYLYLEFRKGNRYRTICIGQRAQKGKDMAFWGFVLTDGRRIGYDFDLYQEIGSTRIPYSKQEMKKVLGDANPFTEAQKEYMALVNRYIFGFPRMELYEQFIRLLIKVRAPKLSKEFKPTRVYEILNDSLQTLSDEDLRAMVDAMEKMDDIQDRLESLKHTFKDLQNIGVEYDHYNRFMLARKAAAYLTEKRQAESAAGKLEYQIAELERKRQTYTEKEQRKIEVENGSDLLVKEKEAIGFTDLDEATQQLRQKKEQNQQIGKETQEYSRRIEMHHTAIREHDGQIRRIQGMIDGYEQELDRGMKELDEFQETVNFTGHSRIYGMWKDMDFREKYRHIKEELDQLSEAVQTGAARIQEWMAAQALWDQASEGCDALRLKALEAKKMVLESQKAEYAVRDGLIESFCDLEQKNSMYRLTKTETEQISGDIQRYAEPADYARIQQLTFRIWKTFEGELEKRKSGFDSEYQNIREKVRICRDKLRELEAEKEVVPVRRESTIKARAMLADKGISALAFYEAVDFVPGLSVQEKNLLEAQLACTGILDALLVSGTDYERALKELHDYSDVLLHSGRPQDIERHRDGRPQDIALQRDNRPQTDGCFTRLRADVVQDSGESLSQEDIVSGTQMQALREAAQQILSGIGEKPCDGAQIVLGADGYFRHGLLEGYCTPDAQACYIGAAARQEKKECLIREKQQELRELTGRMETAEKEADAISAQITVLKKEYETLPSFEELNRVLAEEKEAAWQLRKYEEEYTSKQLQKEECERKKAACEQSVIASCRHLPYARTVEAYEEVRSGLEGYRKLYGNLYEAAVQLEKEKSGQNAREQMIEQESEAADREELQKRRAQKESRELQLQIEKLEEFIQAPENRQKAKRLQEINEILALHQEELTTLGNDLAVLADNIKNLEPAISNQKDMLVRLTGREMKLRSYFEEELGLGLVLTREDKNLSAAAESARGLLKESERNRSVAETVSNLDRMFHMHGAGLSGYGTFLEECFEDDEEEAQILRKRHRIVSFIQGKKLYFEDFYQVIKDNIDSTELLIRQKDRELFENILSDTLSRKLNTRIAESRRWIHDMSVLMQEMDTSMSLSFSLEWKAKTAESDGELDTAELEKLLNRDRELLTTQDIDRISAHFRNRIYAVKKSAEENGDIINYSDLVRDALDYRKWFEFRMYYYRNSGNKKELTNAAFNRFSGGEKAMAMYVPLFAAVNAQYQKAENEDHPRIVALDEAFAGVDDKNINSMFELVGKFDFDYIMNSQVLWGCYESVTSLRIAELLRPANSQVVTVIYYLWNGKQKVIDEQ